MGNKTELKHTPEPWDFNSDKILGTVIRSEGLILSKMRVLEGIDHEANAARIVECVNAMANIENPKEWVDKVKEAYTAIDITNALLGFLTHVGNEEKPFTSRIQMFDSKMDAADIVLWACKADAYDSPIQRVIELRKELTETQAEVIKLKAELKAVFKEQALKGE